MRAAAGLGGVEAAFVYPLSPVAAIACSWRSSSCRSTDGPNHHHRIIGRPSGGGVRNWLRTSFTVGMRPAHVIPDQRSTPVTTTGQDRLAMRSPRT